MNGTAQEAAALVAFFNGDVDDSRTIGPDRNGRDWGTVGDFLFHPIIIRALRETLTLAVVSMALGIVLGVLLGVMRVSSNPLASGFASLYVWVWRATPVILQLLIIYFGLRQVVDADIFRDEWTRWRAAVITFSLNEAAYMAEIVRILRDEGYEGVLIPDHTPEMSCNAPWHAGKAFALGYMRALVQNAAALGPSVRRPLAVAAE